MQEGVEGKEGLNGRQNRIMEMLHVNGEVKISELKQLFEVTDMTLRRDFEKLERMGVLRRTFGGAILASADVALRDRSAVLSAEKERIGHAAARLVMPGDSVFIDGGSTTLQVARHLPPQASITVVTNALNVAAELVEKKIPAIVVGGILVDATNSMVGPIAADTVERLAFDKAFLGATAMNARHGFSNSNLHEAEIKRLALRKAKETVIVMDHTKFGESELVSFAGLQDVQKLVTDEWPEAELLAACRESGMAVLKA